MNEALLSILSSSEQATFLTLLQNMLAIPATNKKSALDRAGQLVGEAFQVDKVDVLVYDPSIETLVAIGTNDTPMSQKERAIGMDRLPIVNGGRIPEVFQTGNSYLNGRVDEDMGVLPGFREGLGIRSMVAVTIDVNGERRGCLTLSSTEQDMFSSALEC